MTKSTENYTLQEQADIINVCLYLLKVNSWSKEKAKQDLKRILKSSPQVKDIDGTLAFFSDIINTLTAVYSPTAS